MSKSSKASTPKGRHNVESLERTTVSKLRSKSDGALQKTIESVTETSKHALLKIEVRNS